MSRTYRRSSVTDEMTKVSYINKYKKLEKKWRLEPVLTEEAELAFNRDMAVYEEKYLHFQHMQKSNHLIHYNPEWYCGRKPEIWQYKKWVAVKTDIDLEKVEKELSDEYDECKRDGRNKESGRNKAFKRLNKKAIRSRNRVDVFKEIHDDEGCKIPYAGDYIGKKYVWSIW